VPVSITTGLVLDRLDGAARDHGVVGPVHQAHVSVIFGVAMRPGDYLAKAGCQRCWMAFHWSAWYSAATPTRM
jgi:hypothetical protein